MNVRLTLPSSSQRREEEQAELGLDVADRLAAQLAAGGELDLVRRALALAEQLGVRIGCATAAAAAAASSASAP